MKKALLSNGAAVLLLMTIALVQHSGAQQTPGGPSDGIAKAAFSGKPNAGGDYDLTFNHNIDHVSPEGTQGTQIRVHMRNALQPGYSIVASSNLGFVQAAVVNEKEFTLTPYRVRVLDGKTLFEPDAVVNALVIHCAVFGKPR